MPPLRFMKRRHLVLAGAGHSHLKILSHVCEYAARGCQVTLISPDMFWYSGMGPGILSETYCSEENRVDTAMLVTQKGGTFIRDRVCRIDAAARTVTLSGGRKVPYDLMSVNVGSEIPSSTIEGAETFGWPVKPIANLTRLHDAVCRSLANGRRARIVVAGGGAAGCEVALNLSHLLRKHGAQREIRIVASGAALLEKEGIKASRQIAREMARLGIEIFLRRKASRVGANEVHLDDGSVFACDFAVLATGVRPPSLFRGSGLATASDGSLLVNPFLQSVVAPEILGAGDCIGFESGPPPRVGVYAVRESEVLHHNLCASLDGRKLRRFRPPNHYLLILNLGDGRGLFLWRNWACSARWAFHLKNFLDCRFVRKYRPR